MELIKKIAPLALVLSVLSMNVSAMQPTYMQRSTHYKSLTLTSEQREQIKNLTLEQKKQIQTAHEYIEIAQAEIKTSNEHTQRWLDIERNRRFRAIFNKKK